MTIAIDLVPIQAGRGGTGGGIWTYASNLVQALDKECDEGLNIVVFARPDQQLSFKKLTVYEIRGYDSGRLARLRWVHVTLPILCRRLKINVLHKLASEIPVYIPDVNVVVTVHDFMADWYRRRGVNSSSNWFSRVQCRYFQFMDSFSLKKACVVIVPTRAVAAEATARYEPLAPRITVIPNGLDSARYAHSSARHDSLSGGGGPIRILYLASMSPHKGQEKALRAFAHLIDSRPRFRNDVSLVLHGHSIYPEYEASLKRCVASNPALRSRVVFESYTESSCGADLYSQADIVMLLSEYEGFGLPPLEAQAAGVPVIVSDIAVLREVLGNAALFVDSESSACVADAIESVLVNRGVRVKLVEAGRLNSRRFSWNDTAVLTMATYRKLT